MYTWARDKPARSCTMKRSTVSSTVHGGGKRGRPCSDQWTESSCTSSCGTKPAGSRGRSPGSGLSQARRRHAAPPQVHVRGLLSPPSFGSGAVIRKDSSASGSPFTDRSGKHHTVRRRAVARFQVEIFSISARAPAGFRLRARTIARTGRQVRCYVPTHSLLNYAHWHIVSPESSLAQLKGCDGYIAQVWTGTSRTPNVYRAT